MLVFETENQLIYLTENIYTKYSLMLIWSKLSEASFQSSGLKNISVNVTAKGEKSVRNKYENQNPVLCLKVEAIPNFYSEMLLSGFAVI